MKFISFTLLALLISTIYLYQNQRKDMLKSMKFLTQKEAVALDQELFKTFSVENLMELAGLSVAQVVSQKYPPDKFPRVLVLAGPGNNGGDGLVAARHLHHFRYDKIDVTVPKLNKKEMFTKLVEQCKQCNIGIMDNMLEHNAIENSYDVILDCIFGFSFRSGNGIRAPFDTVLSELVQVSGTPVVSVDVPSGWDVETGRPKNKSICLEPETLISLTAPKVTASNFNGAHFLGGRFVPPTVASKYKVVIPEYESPLHQYVDITSVVMSTDGDGNL